MQLRHFSLAGLVALASAQSMNGSMSSLTAVLNSTSSLSNLTSYVSLFPSLLSQLGQATNITILAPNNAAFAKFLMSPTGQALANDTAAIEAVLMYHVLNGTYFASNFTSSNESMFIPTMLSNPMYANVTGGQRVEAMASGGNVTFFSGLLANSSVAVANVNFTGGVIHEIDTVLTIPLNASSTALASNLTSLVGAVEQLNLTDTVDGLGDVTIFAPNNAAFQAIGSALGNLSTTQLTSILEYHILNGTVGYSSILMNESLTTLAGSNLTITVDNGTVFVNSAKVIIPNVLIAGGVCHVIDNVLNPMNSTATPQATASTQAPAFAGASSATNVPFTSGVAVPTSVAPTTAGAGMASSTSGIAVPMKTGAIGVAALFGAGAAIMNA